MDELENQPSNSKTKIMINSLKYCLCFFALSFLLVSCSPVVSELWLNKNQSGRMDTSFDLGEMAGMAQGMMQELSDGDEAQKKAIWDREEMIDSTLNFYTFMPDSIKDGLENPEVLKNVNLHLLINSEKEEAKMTVSVAFDSEGQLNEIFNSMASMKKTEGPDQLSNVKINYRFDVERGVIHLPGNMPSIEDDPEFAQMIGSLDSLETMDPEKMMLLEMMFGGESKLIIHAPDKIEFTNDKDAIIEGNKVTFTDNLLDIIKAGKSKDRLIKFKI